MYDLAIRKCTLKSTSSQSKLENQKPRSHRLILQLNPCNQLADPPNTSVQPCVYSHRRRFHTLTSVRRFNRHIHIPYPVSFLTFTMRLINTKTLELEDYPGNEVPPYAILSHRWQDEEVSFRDMRKKLAPTRKGYDKVTKCCDQAIKDGLDYVWVDTLCIDKSSSAELSESINSMYAWYRDAKVCYSYLFDVPDSSITSSFGESVWFTRGWTLQELIAPCYLKFFNAEWAGLGTKDELKDVISEVTGIDKEVLAGTAAPQTFSIAQRMSWASKRTTTKVEDIAYSLLGLFDINMSLLYGEGHKAFTRLQEKLLKRSDDQSLFAWNGQDDSTYRGLLAKSPAEFSDSTNIIHRVHKHNRQPYTVTNMGLRIELPLIQWEMDVYLAWLDCQRLGGDHSRVGVFVTPLKEKDQFARVMPKNGSLATVDETRQAQYKQIYVKHDISVSPSPLPRLYGFWLRHFPPVHSHPNYAFEFTAWSKWDPDNRLFKIPSGQSGTAAVMRYSERLDFVMNLKLGFDFDFNPVCQLGGAFHTRRSNGGMVQSAFDAAMAPGWMDGRLEGVHVGDRLSGLQFRDPSFSISIVNETVAGTRMWVVYIARSADAGRHKHHVCDGCELLQYPFNRVSLTYSLFLPRIDNY